MPSHLSSRTVIAGEETRGQYSTHSAKVRGQVPGKVEMLQAAAPTVGTRGDFNFVV